MEILEKLFSSGARVKMLRFFLMNPEAVFTPAQIAKSCRLTRAKVRQEANLLKAIGFLKKGIRETQIVFPARGGSASGRKTKRRPRKKREPGFQLHSLFPYLRELRALVVEAASISRELLTRRFKRLGKGIRLVLLSGVFIKSSVPGHIDILVVGDNIKRSKVEKILGKIETELGKELNYALFDTKEFKYRQGMYDRFILDILESEHDILINNQGA